ncbi:hypothetical protein VCSRO121_3475 [Vibrio cholerae]|nr:hypothetical protein VCSRO121_3475 [Vibrio cholerae]
MKKLATPEQAAQQTTMNVDSFVVTPISAIIEKYAAAFKAKVMSKTAWIDTHKASREHGVTDIRVWDKIIYDEMVTRTRVSEQSDHKREVMTKRVNLEMACNPQQFLSIVEKLIKDGWTVAPTNQAYYKQGATVFVMYRPDDMFTQDDERIEKAYDEYVEQVTNKQRADYFNVDKVSSYVEDYQQTEKEQFLKARSESLSTILSKYTK